MPFDHKNDLDPKDTVGKGLLVWTSILSAVLAVGMLTRDGVLSVLRTKEDAPICDTLDPLGLSKNTQKLIYQPCAPDSKE